MKLTPWLLALVVAAATVAVCSGAAVQADSDATVVVSGSEDQNKESGFFISGIIDILLRPLKTLIKAQIESIINSIKDQGGHIIGNAKKLIDALTEIIRPFIIRILDQINNIIGAGVELKERLRMAVQALFDYVGIIGDANKEIIKALINYIVDKLLPTAAELDVHRQLLAPTAPLLLGGIRDKLVAPLVEFARRQLRSMLLSLVDQAGLAGERLLEHAASIAELMRPHVLRILEAAGGLHAEVGQLREAVREVVAAILGGIGAIGVEGAEMVGRLIDLVTDILVDRIAGNAFLLAATREDAFLIIDRIIGWIVQPILNKINSILDQIRQLVEDKTDEAKAKLLRLYDELTAVLRGPVIRIIGVLGDIGIEIGDAAKAIKRALETIIDSVSGIHEANKAIFKSILSHIVSSLLAIIEGDKARIVGEAMDFSILVEIISRILNPIIGLVNETLSKLREQIENKVDEATELIRKAVDILANILAGPIAKIVEIFIQIGIGSRDLVENVRIIMNLILNNLGGIAEANKQLLSQMLGDLMRRIIDLIRAGFPL